MRSRSTQYPLWQRFTATLLLPAQLFALLCPTWATVARAQTTSAPALSIQAPQPPTELLRKQQSPSSPARTPKRTNPAELRQKSPTATQIKRLADTPTDVAIQAIPIFPEPLTYSGPKSSPDENQAVARLLEKLQQQPAAYLETLAAFIQKHPKSGWTPALENNLAQFYYDSGYFSKALDAWAHVWTTTQDRADPNSTKIAAQALANLAVMNARIGRVYEVEKLLAFAGQRSFRSNLQPLIQRAYEGLATMKSQPGISFRCGPYALSQIVIQKTGSCPPDFLANVASPVTGFSLAQVQQMASQRLHLELQMAKRSAGAAVITPSIVHWKLDHYAAILTEANGTYFIKDPTFGNDTSMSIQAIDEESTGYFLVPAGPLPAGWSAVSIAEGQTIFGKGYATSSDNSETRDDSHKQGGDCGGKGMAAYQFHTMLASLTVFDTPLGYQPAYGPAINFRVNYNQREAGQPTTMLYSNLGPQWNCNFLSYIEEVPIIANLGGTPTNIGCDAEIHLPSGGIEKHAHAAIELAAVHRRGAATLYRSGATYTHTKSDGSKMIYDYAIGPVNSRRKIFLSQIVSPQNHALTLIYDTSPLYPERLVSLVDATGLVSTLHYEDPASPYLITKVEDPYGRTAVFVYSDIDDSKRLITIRDVIGLESAFRYDATGFLYKLITPYGQTTFSTQNPASTSSILRWVAATDPNGDTERVEFGDSLHGVSALTAGDVPAGLATAPQWMQYRNSFYWSKKAYAEHYRDPAHAHIYHWHHLDGASVSAGTLEAEIPPLEKAIWYNYPGQTQGVQSNGSSPYSSAAARVVLLPNGFTASQISRTVRNTIGNPTKVTDPLGRQTSISYASNAIDVAMIHVATTSGDIAPGNTSAPLSSWTSSSGTPPPHQDNGPSVQVAAFTYNNYHQPLTATDAAGQTTTYTYNSARQLRTVTNSKNETTTYWYHPTGQTIDFANLDPAATGYLVAIDGPLPGSSDRTLLTYDGYGRPRTVTDTTGYTVTTDYDLLDRPTQVTYPDGTYEQVLYTRMHAEWSRDRSGRWTQTLHDSLRRPVITIDPLYRKTSYDWCSCGSLSGLTDPTGNRTTWIRDTKGRVTSKIYPDNTTTSYAYDPRTNRLASTTDALGRRTNYAYNLDDTLAQVSYTNTAGQPLTPATPTVTYAYDPIFSRLTSLTDGTGTTNLTYLPYATARVGNKLLGSPYFFDPISANPGAGQLASIDGPLDNDTLTYAYDQLGRVTTQTLGTASTTLAYDTLGRLQTLTDPLGTFGYTYEGTTSRLTRLDYPNGQTTTYDYHPQLAPTGTGNGDHRLAQIQNLLPGGNPLSTHAYQYATSGNITSWAHTTYDPSPITSNQTYTYDTADQLISATYDPSPITHNLPTTYTYRYDSGGNRLSEQINTHLTTATHNNLNQLTAHTPGGPMTFAGTLDRPANVTLAGQPANVDAANRWQGTAPVTPGANTIPLVATEPDGTSTAKNIQVTVTGGQARTLTYDLVGNLLSNTPSPLAPGLSPTTYTWDALNRLVKITQGTDVTEFTYNHASQRVQEKLNGSVIKQWIWTGGTQPAEERDASNNTTKRFLTHGQQNLTYNPSPLTDNLFFTTDHLGSVREMTDQTGAVRARYDYDPYGRVTKVSGDLEASFGFTGHYRHQASGLHLALYRAYDAELGRWLSRDFLGEVGPDGPNVYSYVNGDPINQSDPLGLAGETTATRLGKQAHRNYSSGTRLQTQITDKLSLTRTRATVHEMKGVSRLANPSKFNQAVNQLYRQMNEAAQKFPDKEISGKLVTWEKVSSGFKYSEVMEINWGRAGAALGILAIIGTAARAEEIAHNMLQHACDIKNGDEWGAIALHEDMQDLAPGAVGHFAWLVALGNM